MAKKTVELLLMENVDNLGIVGDVVRVKTGYARNYLVPRGLVTQPSQELIAQLAERRAEAQRELERVRAERENMVSALDGYVITVVRATNDQGLLYGSVTQQDVADLLAQKGFTVRARDVRLGQTIKRIGDFELTVRPERDLEATIKLIVESEGGLEVDDRDDEPADQQQAPEADAPAEAQADQPA